MVTKNPARTHFLQIPLKPLPTRIRSPTSTMMTKMTKPMMTSTKRSAYPAGV